MICHFSHSCERMNCGSEVHGKDEILSRGIPVHWRSCVRNTLFCISGFKRTTPHFLVWAEYVVNFQNNTAVFLAVWFVMAKAAVKKKKKAQQQQKQCYHPVAVCTQPDCLWFTLQKISIMERLLYFQERGERNIFPIWSVSIYFHTSSVRREYKVLLSCVLIFSLFASISFCSRAQRTENKMNSNRKGSSNYIFSSPCQKHYKEWKKQCLTLSPRTG